MHGFLYFLSIPSMYMLLMIYALTNLNVVSWGTREVKTTKTEKEEQEAKGQGEPRPRDVLMQSWRNTDFEFPSVFL